MVSSGWNPSKSQGTGNWMLPIPITVIVSTDEIVLIWTTACVWASRTCLPPCGLRNSASFVCAVLIAPTRLAFKLTIALVIGPV
jgi:hypothetical protein